MTRHSLVDVNTRISRELAPSSGLFYLPPMLALLKLIQSLIKTLHSAGTPGQVAAGMALGSALGLTPGSTGWRSS